MSLLKHASRLGSLTRHSLAAALLTVVAVPLLPAHAAASDNARVIVRFKADSALTRMRALSASGDAAPERAQLMAQRLGLALRAGGSIGERSQVIHASGIDSAALAARLASQPDVELAVVDRRRRALAIPNDPLYLAGGVNGPAAGQWYLRPPTATTPAAINAESAWDVTLGSSNVVVAVLDTGIRFDHADLRPVAVGGNILSGYDFISDAATGNDGDGRDADPTDPGDWITAAENSGGPFANCGVSNSSWHGTEVIALIGAATDNGFGMASIGRNVRVLPIRVLGKCGGFDSDILAAMRWAAGLAVPGVPPNPTPARIINLSLGAEGSCSSLYSSTIAEVNAQGSIVIASAGNSAGHAVSEPANCPGAIGVAATRHVGTKVGFSDLGPEIALSAPGGNCVDISPGAACRFPILTARNAGTTVPVAGSSAFSDSFQITVGTSFAAPMVSGTAALMLSVRPASTPAEIRLLLQQSARPFPTTGGDNGDGSVVPQCQPPGTDSSGKPIDQLQCYCTTTTCGAGMLDASAAVRAAAGLAPTPSAPIPTPTPTPTPAPSGGGGGGALGWPWLLGLLAAVVALGRTRRPRTA
ncbi:S8 family peptidase [Piscinibacter sakaiensis]|uniref:S8 family peptidase n=1 Tax=Piscinibacter sakaiensis TaxID=1547922 RepID=UPI003AB07CF6